MVHTIVIFENFEKYADNLSKLGNIRRSLKYSFVFSSENIEFTQHSMGLSLGNQGDGLPGARHNTGMEGIDVKLVQRLNTRFFFVASEVLDDNCLIICNSVRSILDQVPEDQFPCVSS